MSKTILTIDDSASIRQMVAVTLSAAGYRVLEACDGADGYGKATVLPALANAILAQLSPQDEDDVPLMQVKVPMHLRAGESDPPLDRSLQRAGLPDDHPVQKA